jgi:hypothetical protein
MEVTARDLLVQLPNAVEDPESKDSDEPSMLIVRNVAAPAVWGMLARVPSINSNVVKNETKLFVVISGFRILDLRLEN